MKVLVTGANGHIGANVVRALLAKQHEVVAFVRPSADLQGLAGLDVTYAYGDVLQPDTLANATQGCDAIIHLAAVYKTIAKTAEEIVTPAVEGAKNIFAAAHNAGIKRIVYTSSIASVGFSYDRNVLRTGNDWNTDPQNPYYIAKTQSERSAQDLARKYNIHLVVICPAIVLGPFDYRVTPSNQLVRDWINGKGQTYRGGINIVDVRDVADAHVSALTHGENCHRYIVGGENIEVKNLGKIIQQLTDIKPIYLPTGRKTTLVAARIIEYVCRLLRVNPPFTYDLAYEVVERFAYYDCSDTVRDLHLNARDAEQTLRDCVHWLININQFNPELTKKLTRKLSV